MRRKIQDPWVIASGTLLLVMALFIVGIIKVGHPGPSPDEARAQSQVSATATVRALQIYGSPTVTP